MRYRRNLALEAAEEKAKALAAKLAEAEARSAEAEEARTELQALRAQMEQVRLELAESEAERQAAEAEVNVLQATLASASVPTRSNSSFGSDEPDGPVRDNGAAREPVRYFEQSPAAEQVQYVQDSDGNQHAVP
eukprot:2397768-Prymnesium_polylepis.1